MLNVGIAGCGLVAGAPLDAGRPIATNHATACSATPGCQLVAVADPDSRRRTAFANYWGLVNVYSSVAEMLKRHQLDILIVATPAASHQAVCQQAIAARVRGILCEKPLTGHAVTAQAVVDLCRHAAIPLVVNFTRRWDATHQALAARLGAGAIGPLRAVFGTYTGTLRGNGSHLVDTVNMLTHRSDWSCNWTSKLALGSADGPVAATLSAGDIVFSMTAVPQAEYFIFELQFLGTKGRARMLLGGNDVRLDFPRLSEQYPGYSYLLDEQVLGSDSLPNAFSRALAALASAVRGERELPFSAEAHIATLACVDSLIVSATNV